MTYKMGAPRRFSQTLHGQPINSCLLDCSIGATLPSFCLKTKTVFLLVYGKNMKAPVSSGYCCGHCDAAIVQDDRGADSGNTRAHTLLAESKRLWNSNDVLLFYKEDTHLLLASAFSYHAANHNRTVDIFSPKLITVGELIVLAAKGG